MLHLLTLAAMAMVGLPASRSQAAEVPFERTSLDATAGVVGGVAVGDLDGDARADVVAAFTTDGEVRWWRSSYVFLGDQGAISTGLDGASSVALGDIDGDGDLDVVVAAPGIDTVRWCENTAGDASSWSDRQIAGAATGVSAVVVGDLDGDGDLDVVGAVTGANLVRWWRNDAGNGTAWSPHLVSGGKTGVADVALADLDRDGDLDVLAAVPGLDRIVWWRNDGSGGGWSSAYHDTVLGAGTVAAGDLDDDGDLDLVAGGSGEDAILWWDNTARDGSSYTRATLGPSFVDPVDLATADVDQDGDGDVLATGAAAAGWWDNESGDGSVWVFRDLPSVHQEGRIAAGDVVGDDGFVDIVASSTHGTGYLEAQGNRRIHRSGDFPLELTLAGNPTGVSQLDWALGDVDRDGVRDLVIVDDNLTHDAAWIVFGSAGYYELTEIEAVESVALGDVDRDGDLDLVFAVFFQAGGRIEWVQNVDGTLTTIAAGSVIDPQNDGDDYWFRQLRMADMDGDGDLDVLAVGNEIGFGDLVGWWENDPATLSTAWPQHTIDTAQRHSAEAVDLDRDGDLDVVAGYEGGSDLVWYENLDGGASSWSLPQTIDADGAWRIAVGDLDGDGDADIAGATVISALGYSSGFRWWENRLDAGTAPVWVRHELDESIARDIAMGDLDGDGDLDLLTAAGSDGGSWYRNDGESIAGFERVDVAAGYTGERVTAVDFEGDGFLDYVLLDPSWLLHEFRNLGAEAAVRTETIAPAYLAPGSEEPVYVVDVFHRGIAEDPAMELAGLEFLVQADGLSAESAQFASLLETMRLWHDDGSGTFDPNVDTEVASLADPVLTYGRFVWTLPDDVADLSHVVADTPQRYFVTLELEPDADQQGVDGIVMRLFSEDSLCENAEYDLPVAVELASQGVASFSIGQPLFADDFESGDASAWTSNAP